MSAASYLPYALLSMGAYALVSPLMRVATTGPDAIPSDVAVIITNLILVGLAASIVVYTGQEVTGTLGSSKLPHVIAAGIFLGIGIIALYRALALGPVSVVTPIFAMFLVFSSVIGIVLLGESFTARKGIGIVFAVIAVYLVSGT
ncbi:EamA family transporter [Halorubrum vacuolatum]|uniref:Transporter family protein n=1 Tax=Halorubrum vacuolatum TaxID=63740 RepID=A0A238WY63_HALVU|nr:EamA family transporter [Halorubrum vacuolatum]SNR51487.1 transporter family protein [Halorubrum vacuolatum]